MFQQRKKKDEEKHITNGETEISCGDYHLCRIMSIFINSSQKIETLPLLSVY